jgi:hypothetical protein
MHLVVINGSNNNNMIDKFKMVSKILEQKTSWEH